MADMDETMPGAKAVPDEPSVADDRFVPVRAGDLIHALAEGRAVAHAVPTGLDDVGVALQAIIEQEAAALERRICDDYAGFSPDRDTLTTDPPAAGQETAAAELRRLMYYLLHKANFQPLSAQQIRAAIDTPNSYGLRVHLEDERVGMLSIWARGRTRITRQKRCWRTPFRGQEVEVPVYQRLVVAARMKDSPHLTLKLFKEIPVEDLEALLPHARVEMNWFDRLKVIGGGAGALGSTATKLFTAAAVGKLIWVVAFGLGTLVLRTVLGYRRACDKREWQRTRHLYYQNLSNNAGVIHSLLAMIAQEELKEAVLAYAFCTVPTQDAPESEEDLRARVQAWLRRRWGVDVRFDVADALETLTRLNLWTDRSRFRVLAPAEAVERLSAHWHARSSESYHLDSAVSLPEPEAPGTDA